MNETWNEILKMTRHEFGDQQFRAWFEPTELASFNHSSIVLKVPNKYFQDWIEDNYQQFIIERATTILQRPITSITYVWDTHGSEPEGRTSGVGFQSNLDADLTFENFIVGRSNEFAAAAARNVAEAPSTNYNPLFFFSDVGLGKTHLMHAIGNAIIKQNPSMRVLYVRAEEYYQQFVDSLKRSTPEAFQERYRQTVDVLLVDDVQFFSVKKSATSEHFFHTFNALHMARKQIVLTADKKPHELEGMEERLRSRFAMGLVTDITYPDDETRMAILLNRAAATAISLPQDVAYYVSSRVPGNIRVLLGCLQRIAFFAQYRKEPLSIEFVQEEINNYLGEQQRSLSVEAIAAHVATYFNIHINELKGPSRKKAFSQARHIAMYLARTLIRNATYERIGDFYRRDHSTVIEAVRKIEDQVDLDQQLRSHVDNLRRGLEGMGQ